MASLVGVWTAVVLTVILVKPATATQDGPCHFVPLIDAQVGDNVTLRCCFTITLPNTVDWRLAGSKRVVHVYRNGRDDPDPQALQYRHRTALNHEDLTRSVMTLHIFSVHFNDSNVYTCNVPNGPNFQITLQVRHRLQSTTGVYTNMTSTEQDNRKKPYAENMAAVVGVCFAVLTVCLLSGLVILLKPGNIQECCPVLQEMNPAVGHENTEHMKYLQPLKDGDEGLNVSTENNLDITEVVIR